MGTERAVTVSARKRFTREHVAGTSKSTARTNRGSSVERDEQERRMRVWEGHTVLNLLRADEDGGWVVAMIVIGFTTFVVYSSIFVKGGSFAKYV